MEISMEEQLKELQQKVDEKFEETPTMQDPEEEYIQMVESLTENILCRCKTTNNNQKQLKE